MTDSDQIPPKLSSVESYFDWELLHEHCRTELAGVTWKELATRCGLNYPMFYQIAHGKHMPGLDTYMRICAGLRVAPSRFLRNKSDLIR